MYRLYSRKGKYFCYMDYGEYEACKSDGWVPVKCPPALTLRTIVDQPTTVPCTELGPFIDQYLKENALIRYGNAYIQAGDLIKQVREKFGVTLRARDLGIGVVSVNLKKIGPRKMWQFPKTWQLPQEIDLSVYES